jgi:RAQPRD family integrative conjugative element protein
MYEDFRMSQKISFSMAKLLLIFSLASNPLLPAIADTDNPTTSDAEKAYLVQIINQLDAMQPLIIAAQNAQLSDKRVQFHYRHYQDSQGKTQNGLLEDVQAIKAGITQYLNQPAIEPRNVQPLQGDYLNIKPVPDNQNNLVSNLSLNASTVDIVNSSADTVEVPHDSVG